MKTLRHLAFGTLALLVQCHARLGPTEAFPPVKRGETAQNDALFFDVSRAFFSVTAFAKLG